MMKQKKENLVGLKERVTENLATNLKYFRKNLKLTQKELGKHCGVHEQTIKNIENKNSNITLENLLQLSLELNTHYSILLIGKEEFNAFSKPLDIYNKHKQRGPGAIEFIDSDEFYKEELIDTALRAGRHQSPERRVVLLFYPFAQHGQGPT